MERQSDKHGSRLDDEMELETRPLEQGASTEPRVQESREKEPPGPDEPVPDDRIEAGPGQSEPTALAPSEVEARRELARHIEGAVFPADREAIIESARGQHAPQSVIATLERLPDRTYEAFPEVWEALGGPREGTREDRAV